MIASLKELLTKLISFQSITPQDAGCQDYIINILQKLGFTCEKLDNPPVANFFAQIGDGSPLLIFAGHTDVVPVGDLSKWNSDPFILHEKDSFLYGRGCADMKGSLACMLIAAERFLKHHTDFNGRLGFLITSGEEGDDFELGTPYVMQELIKRGIKPDYCIVGEPSSTTQVGDMIKIGRRGSLTGVLQLHGKQGHVAYPHLAENPIHKIAPALLELTNTVWDKGNVHFPPTSLQITRIQAGGQANNIIPGELILHFNFRYCTEQTADVLKQTVHQCFSRHALQPSIQWRLNGEPFLTSSGKLLETCVGVIKQETNLVPELSTSGGTSDGRFIAPYGVELVELGPVNATIHQVNECVALQDLEKLSDIYYFICEKMLQQKKYL